MKLFVWESRFGVYFALAKNESFARTLLDESGIDGYYINFSPKVFSSPAALHADYENSRLEVNSY